MRKIKGFRLGKRLMIRISKWILRKPSYQSLNKPSLCKSKTLSKLIKWGRSLSNKTRSFCSIKPGSGYVPVGEEPMKEKLPKGHLAVYVGQKEGDFHRVLLPIIYVNHPLFGELLREAEEEYGFAQPGGITIPCRYSEFESVKTKIDAAGGGRRMVAWRRHC